MERNKGDIGRRLVKAIESADPSKTLLLDDLAPAFFKAEQKQLRSGALFFDCFQCGKIPWKCVRRSAKKIGPGFTGRMWWQLTCPGCNSPVISPLWRL